jgi:hypothetical protein
LPNICRTPNGRRTVRAVTEERNDVTQADAEQARRTGRRRWTRRDWTIAGVITAAILVVIAVMVANQPTPLEEMQAKADSQRRIREALSATVLFEVSTSGDAAGRSVDITMKTPAGGTSQQSGVRLPLTRKDGSPFSFIAQSGDFVYLSAQNNQAYGDVTCTIRVDDQVLQTATSSGEYVIASCSGTVP